MSKESEGEQLVTRMQPDEIEALTAIARAAGIPRARLVRQVLRDFLEARGLTDAKR